MLHLAAALGGSFCLAGMPSSSRADGPSSEGARVELPRFAPEPAEQRWTLPSLSLPAIPTTDGLRAGLAVFVRGYRFSGNTALSDDELRALARPYANRMISFEDLQQLKDGITRLYVARGYLSSGAILPSQRLESGEIEFQIVEGRMAEIQIRTDGRLRRRYLEARLRPGTSSPVNVHDLERSLALLELDPNVRVLRAALRPGERPGESALEVDIGEANAWIAELEADNSVAPSIGANQGRIRIGNRNVTGFGDEMSATFARSEGLVELGASYAVPINRYDTTFELDFRSSRSEVIEKPFDSLEIESRSTTYSATIRHPLHRSPTARFEFALTGEIRRSKSFLLGRAFSFAEGVEEGESRIAVVRFVQEWTQASERQVLAARSSFNLGIDAFDATIQRSSRVPDGRFLSWVGQIQWARRFDLLNAQLIARTDVQLSRDPLLGLEQFSIGGQGTVRGYRENELVRDNGIVGSVEFRIPIRRDSNGRSIVELAAFADAGRSWNKDRPSPGPSSLVGCGLGIRISPTPRLRLELFWAEGLRDTLESGAESNLQDRGIHFRAATTFF